MEELAPYTIYAESTPNPNTMKFVANKLLVSNGRSYEILANQRVGGPSPLAEKLFQFPFLNGVFISNNFVTLTKSDVVEWTDVVMELREFIKEALNEEGAVIIREEFLQEPASEGNEEKEMKSVSTNKAKAQNSPIDDKIVAILDEYIRPAVEGDGGAIEFDSFDEGEGVVKVILKGSCSGCPSSTMTLKSGIESLLNNMLPEVKEVVAING